MTKFYGISGYVGSGKDTFGIFLSDEMDCHMDSFAAPMREIAVQCGFRLDRVVKELPEKFYSDLEERLQSAIAWHMGYLDDNTQAELYAHTVDSLEQYWVNSDARCPHFFLSPRQFLQHLGAAGRKVHPNFWIDSLLQRNLAHSEVIVTDVRYAQEHAKMDRLVFINRDHCGPVNGHESERHYEKLRAAADIQIFNNGPLSELKDAAVAVKGIING